MTQKHLKPEVVLKEIKRLRSVLKFILLPIKYIPVKSYILLCDKVTW